MREAVREAVIVQALRTPIGKGKFGSKGALSAFHSAHLLAKVQEAVVERSGIDPAEVEQIIGGCVTQAGEQSNNIARNAWLTRGKQYNVAGTTIDTQCGSSQQANNLVNALVRSGDIDIGIACGVEVMSHVGLGANVMHGPGFFQPADWPWDSTLDQFQSAERIAKKRGITRAECDALALRSQQLAIKATEEGRFKREILPIEAPVLNDDGTPSGTTRTVVADQGIRASTAEGLASLPALVEGGVHTAGSSSQISDGAAAILWMSAERAKQLGLKPRARILHEVVVGSDPYYLLDGPVDATERMMKKWGMKLSDLDLYEINEAFAAVVLSWVKVFNADMDKLNVNGGAIALGHPIGASGGRIIGALVHELQRRGGGLGCAAICSGGGQGDAILIRV